jgi:hypothetical protein
MRLRMNYSKWYSCWGLSPRVSINPNGSWCVGLSDTKHVRRTCKICSSTIWQWCGESPPQDMPRSDFNGLALGTRLASGLGRARQKYVFVPYRDLAYVTRPHEWRIIVAQWGKNLNRVKNDLSIEWEWCIHMQLVWILTIKRKSFVESGEKKGLVSFYYV